MSAPRTELTRQAARLFAEKGYHGTSIGDLAEALGVQKGSLYAHIESKQDLLYETMREGAAAFHARARRDPRAACPPRRRSGSRCARTSRVVAEQLDVATVFVREWRYLEGERRERVRRRAAPLRGADPRALPRGPRAGRAAHRPRRGVAALPLPLGRELGLHVAAAGPRHRRARRPLLRPALDGMRGYSTPG